MSEILGPFDVAVRLLARRPLQILGRYAVVSGPLLAASMEWVSAVSLERRGGLGAASLLVAGGMVWRWWWMPLLQTYVMREIGSRVVSVDRKRAACGFLVRAHAEVLAVLLALLVVPGVLALHAAWLVGPTLSASDRPAWREVRELVSGLPARSSDCLRRALVVAWLGLAGIISAVGFLSLLLSTVLPSLLGIDTTGLALSTGSVAWLLSAVIIALAVLDLIAHTAGVVLARRLSEDQTGSDLRTRLAALAGARA